MKKFILSLGLIAMAFSLTNCVKTEEVNPSVEVKGDFAIYASVSRTANDGLNTVWSAKDEINVFHAVGETTSYVNDTPYTNSVEYPFVCEDAATGYFSGALTGTLDPEEEYDWYAFYPYSSYIKTPANDSAGYTYIGSKAGSAQVQNGNNSMTHIAGTNYPMAGYAVAVPANQQPHLVFNHIASLVEFVVTNKLSEAITVTEIQFTASEDIVGSYYINFANSDAYKFTSSGASYVSNTAYLTVTNGTEIAAGASAKFYAAIKPFTAKADDDLTIKVSASSATGLGAHEKDITLEKDVVFSAGKIKTVKVDYTTAFEAAEEETWQLITSVDEITTGTYVIVAKQKGGAAIAYCPSTTSTSAGPNQVVTTLFDLQTPAFQSNAVPENARWSFTGDASGLTIMNASGNYLYNTATNNGVRVGSTSDSWVITAAKNGAFNLKDTAQSRYLTLYGTSNWRCYTSAYAFGNTDQNGECYLYKLSDGVVVLTPSLTVTPATIEAIPYEGGTATINYTVSNPVDGVSATATSSADWITITPAEGAFNLTIAANEDKARTATITVAYEGAVSRTVTVEQEAKPNDNGGVDIVLDFQTMQNGVSSYTATWTQTCGDYSWSIVNFNNNNKGWKYIKCGSKNAASVASINTKFSIPWAVSNVTVTIDSVTTTAVNSTYLQVATDANFSNVVETVNVTIAKGDLVYTIANPGANYYYKLVYDCNKASSNGPVQISKVVYTAQ